MRILYLAPNIPVPGSHGGSTHVTSVYRALGREHDVLLLARRGSTEPGVLALGLGLAPVVKHLVPAYYLARVLATARRFSPDVVYERYSAFGLGVALGALLDVPSVLMTLDRDASPISLAGSARIVATSSSFIPQRWLGKFREVRWGVDIERFAGARGEAMRAELAPRGERVILYTGSCARWHGLDVLVDVAARWSGPPAVFVVVGHGEDADRVRRLARQRRVAERFVFVGRVPHDSIPGYVAAADVCVAPYAPAHHPIFRRYGMDRDPIKVLEYMALAKPCVTIDTPRMRALVRAGVEAVLYPAEDASVLGAELSALLRDGDRAARIGAAGADLVRRRHSWDRHASELEAIFEEAVSERRAARRR